MPMAGEPGVVVTLDGQVHDPRVPLLHADDLAVVRGDGIFESLLVRDGRACLLEAHLRRLSHSARLMELPEPDLARWRAAVDTAVSLWDGGEAVMRLICSRGRESGSPPTSFVMIGGVADRVAAARRDGVSALTLARGLPAEGAADMPWLLAGAKTLSYAVNMAALRHAERHGAGDVVFVSSEGYVLEGPRSTVVIAGDGDTGSGRPCLYSPPPWYPILRGTTQQALFEVARNKGYDCDYRVLTPADLFAAQGVWLVSSITLAARVHTLDGTLLRPSPLSAEVAELVDAAIVSDR